MNQEFFSFFTFPKKWVGRAMGNEALNWDGLTLREKISVKCHFIDDSNEYKFIYVPSSSSSEKESTFDGR